MRNLDSCRCWRCTLCPFKVRNKFLVNFRNRTILLCIPCTYIYIYICVCVCVCVLRLFDNSWCIRASTSEILSTFHWGKWIAASLDSVQAVWRIYTAVVSKTNGMCVRHDNIITEPDSSWLSSTPLWCTLLSFWIKWKCGVNFMFLIGTLFSLNWKID